MKAALVEKYRMTPKEDRNGQGTVVFLLGREMKTTEDIAFMQEVVTEKPCLSLSDCGRESALDKGEQSHLSGVNGVTLAYPQLVAIHALDVLMKADQVGTPVDRTILKQAAENAIKAGENSGNPLVARKALATLEAIRKRSNLR
jgi:hypothetical protein